VSTDVTASSRVHMANGHKAGREAFGPPVVGMHRAPSTGPTARVDEAIVSALDPPYVLAITNASDEHLMAQTVAMIAQPVEHAPIARTKRAHRWGGYSAGRKVVSVAAGMALAGGAAYGATNWIVALTGGSSGEGQAATIQNLTITSVSTPSPSNELYPGGTGDVVVTITNPNPYPVTITAMDLPTSTTYATGYTNANLTTPQSGCIASTPSDVIWNDSTSSSGSVHTLSTSLVVGASGNANNPLTVTLTNDASMTASAPAACAGAYFSMPSLTGIAASGGAGTATSTPATDGWTS
jgi:hypothetical protein